MKFRLRAAVAAAGLILTAVYWLTTSFLLINTSLVMSCGIVDFLDPSRAPGPAETELRFFAPLVLGTIIYGLGIYLWRRLDEWLARGTSNEGPDSLKLPPAA